MPWTAGKTQIITNVGVSGEYFSDTVGPLNPGEVCKLQVKGNSDGTTDNLDVVIYETLDETAGAEVWDTQGSGAGQLDCTSGNDELFTFTLSGIYKFGIGVARSGSTDTITTDAWVKRDGVNI